LSGPLLRKAIGWSEVAGDLTARPDSTADSAAPRAEPIADPDAPQSEPTADPAQPPAPPAEASSLSQLAAAWSMPEFLERVLAEPRISALVTEALRTDANDATALRTAASTASLAPVSAAPPTETPTTEATPTASKKDLRRVGDRWLEWFLPVLAIALPTFILIIIPYIRQDITTWGQVDLSAQRGDYLIPVLILCAETVRRWCRGVKCRGHLLRGVRIAAVSFCALALIACFASAIAAVEFTPTRASSRSIVTITAWGLIPSLVFGTVAVAAPQKERDE
jgi:hypothetical protein